MIHTKFLPLLWWIILWADWYCVSGTGCVCVCPAINILLPPGFLTSVGPISLSWGLIHLWVWFSSDRSGLKESRSDFMVNLGQLSGNQNMVRHLFRGGHVAQRQESSQVRFPEFRCDLGKLLNLFISHFLHLWKWDWEFLSHRCVGLIRWVNIC